MATAVRAQFRWWSGLRAVLLTAAVLAGCGGAEEAAGPPARPPGQDASLDAVSDAVVDTGLEAAEPDSAQQDAAEDVAAEAAPCTPRTCNQLGANCGEAPDGCGGKITCGACDTGQVCGGAGSANKCGPNPCQPKTCAQVQASCGLASDGCSLVIDCGTCVAPQVCGGAGKDNECGCTPKTCVQLGANCGTAPDGCGAAIECGTCTSGLTCGGGGTNKCGSQTCAAKSCAQLAVSCGKVSDTCSAVIDCGGCAGTDVCGGAGVVNQCGCTPKTCAQLGASCGSVPAGCGMGLDCGTCPTGDTCGGGGVANQCGCACQLPNATTTCGAGGCAIKACSAGFANCDGDDSNGCETNLNTDPANCGACNTSCDDNNACTVGDSCQAGSCVPGPLTACNTPPNAQCYGAAGACEQATGLCKYTPLAANTGCNADNNACTVDQCDGAGNCVAGPAKVCNSPPSIACYNATGSCDPGNGNCSYAPLPSSASCDADGNACTVGDHCNGSGTCVAGTAKVCNAPPNTACYSATGTCAPSTGACSYTPLSSSTLCNADNNACTVGDHCNGSGTCVAGTAKVCNAPPNTACYNATGTCAPSTGACSYTPKTNGTSCGTCKQCTNGTCGNSPTGTQCGNACQYCSSGSCLTRANGYQYDATESHRCCGGNPVDISTNASHCGGCGLSCGTGTCQSVSATSGCSAHPASTSGRCTCTSGTQCPLGRNGLRQTCRTLTPYANLCAPSTAEYCASGESYQNVSSCPNYCYYP